MLGLGSISGQPISSLALPPIGNTYNNSITFAATAGFTNDPGVHLYSTIIFNVGAGFVIAVHLDANPAVTFAATDGFTVAVQAIDFPTLSLNVTDGFIIDPGVQSYNALTFSETAGFIITGDRNAYSILTFSSITGFAAAVHADIFATVAFSPTAGFSSIGDNIVIVAITFAVMAAHIQAAGFIVSFGATFTANAGLSVANFNQSSGPITFHATSSFTGNVIANLFSSQSYVANASFNGSGGNDFSKTLTLAATDGFSIVDFVSFNPTIIFASSAGLGRAVELDANPTLTLNSTNSLIFDPGSKYFSSITFTETADFIPEGDARNSEIYLLTTNTFTISYQENAGPPETIGATASIGFFNQLIANRSIHQTLTFTSTATIAKQKVQHASNHLNIISGVTKTHEHHRSLNQHLVIHSTATRSTVYNRAVSNHLIFKNLLSSPSGINDFVINTYTAVATVQKTQCQVVLQSAGSVIVLPCPILGDTQRPTGLVVNVTHAINGVMYTHIKRNPLQTLKYTFQLDRRKGMEFRLFLKNNIGNIITMYNFKGESWVGYVVNQPDLIAKSRWGNCGPMTEVVVDFEGTKTGG